MTVVRVPEPAIIGNAIGTILPDFVPPLLSVLKNSIPRTISIAKKNIINDPAMAKDGTSKPMNPSNSLPKKKNNKIRMPETVVANPAWISPIFCLIPINIGMEPKMSITANKVKLTVTISVIFNVSSPYMVYDL